MLDSTILKNELKPALITFWESGFSGDEGMTVEDYAEEFARIIAEKIVAHITTNAMVQTTVTGTAGPYPVVGNGQGGIT